MKLFIPAVFDAQTMSFGTFLRGEKRTSNAAPSRSAVAGMIAYALGYYREDVAEVQKIHDNIRVSSRVLRLGEMRTEYQNVRMVSPLEIGGKIVAFGPSSDSLGFRNPDGVIRWNNGDAMQTWREYIVDGAFAIAIEVTNGDREFADTILEALKRPRHVLFLGRKTCTPKYPLVSLDEKVREASHAVEVLCNVSDTYLREVYEAANASIPENRRKTFDVWCKRRYPMLDFKRAQTFTLDIPDSDWGVRPTWIRGLRDQYGARSRETCVVTDSVLDVCRSTKYGRRVRRDFTGRPFRVLTLSEVQ